MPNIQRGEIEAIFDGRPRTLCLTLGALAELEAKLDANDLIALTERFESGQISARETIAVLAAGLRGAGGQETDEDVACMKIDGGISAAIGTVARLFGAAFGGAE